LGFGLLHLLLIWNGDILTEYALVGLFALPFLLLRVRYLAIAAFAFLLAFAMQSSMWSIQWPAADLLKQHVTASNEIFSTGSYADVVQFSYRELPMLLPLHLYVLPRTIALFLFGMLFWRVGVFTNPARYRNQIRFAAAAGVLGGAAIFMISGGGWFASSALFMEGALNLAPAILAVGYGAGILTLMGSPRVATFLGAFAPLGKMAFTNYLLQSVICGFVFFGYGLGQFSHMAVAPAFGFGLVIYAGQMVLSSVWLRYYKFGPVEWAWRSLMYGKIQPMSIK
jgi:uncharacterized protein